MSFRLQIAVVLLLLVALRPQIAHADAVSEDDVKLALVYKITRFVSWPDSVSHADFHICMAGDTSYRNANERLRGRSIRDREVRVSLLRDMQDKDGPVCDVVYLTRQDAQRSDELIEAFAGQPVLMVGDIPNFAESGGMVGLSVIDNRIGMTINAAAYERAGLTISSQLLELARVIGIEQRAGE